MIFYNLQKLIELYILLWHLLTLSKASGFLNWEGNYVISEGSPCISPHPYSGLSSHLRKSCHRQRTSTSPTQTKPPFGGWGVLFRVWLSRKSNLECDNIVEIVRAITKVPPISLSWLKRIVLLRCHVAFLI